MLLLTLRGTPVLYYGDELAMPEAEVAFERVVDPVGKLADPDRPGRDGARTPMPWTDEPGGGFTSAGVEPWLPFGDLAAVNVAGQLLDRGSPLNLTRDLIALRRAEEALRTGAYEEAVVEDGLWAFRRGEGFLVALNLGSGPASVAAQGTIAIGTRRERDGEAIARSLLLAPGEGAVLRLA
jgi:alpha-glucosidase